LNFRVVTTKKVKKVTDFTYTSVSTDPFTLGDWVRTPLRCLASKTTTQPYTVVGASRSYYAPQYSCLQARNNASCHFLVIQAGLCYHDTSTLQQVSDGYGYVD